MDDSRQLLEQFISEQRELLSPIGAEQVEAFLRFENWLVDEGIPAGGVGPNEADRVMRRHVLDSLTMIMAVDSVPADIQALDVGSGAGLPGVPLAIAYPHGHFTLVDRSGRRCQLIKRAVRVLSLDNVTVLHKPVEQIEGDFQLITSRASLPPETLLPHLRRCLAPGGTAVVAGSISVPLEVPGYETREFRSEVLGNSRWMLMMRSS